MSVDAVPRTGLDGSLPYAAKVVVGLTPIVAAVVGIALAPVGTKAQTALAAVLTILYVAAYRAPFKSSHGATVPTEPVLVAMLLTLPPLWVPGLVLTAVAAASFDDDYGTEITPWQRLLTTARSAWNSVAPSVVVLAFAHLAPTTPSWLVLAYAVVAQVLSDALQVLAIATLEGLYSSVAGPVAWMLAVDVMLAVVGYCITTACGPHLPQLFLLAAPILLLHLLARDREEYFEQAENLRSKYSEVNQEARRDPMTGLLNRRGWEEVLAQAAQTLASEEPRATATVLVADLDRLKQTNDTYGHLAGDALICAFADLLVDAAPPGSAVARLGGDEYAVLLVGPTERDSPDLIGAVRTALAVSAPSGPVAMSASLGQATYPPVASLEAAVQEADLAARVDKEMRRMTRGQVVGLTA